MATDELLARLFLDIALLLAISHLLGLLLGRLRQPRILAGLFAGILLGPSLLGHLPGDPIAFLFPAEVQAAFALLGKLGLVLFAFAVGLELELPRLRQRPARLLGVSAGALLLPLAAGAALAVALFPAHAGSAGDGVPFSAFALFMATAMAITAFPVLVSILIERGMRGSPLSELAVGSAAIQDAVGWVLLAAALAALAAEGAGQVALMAAQALAFLAVLYACAGPLLRRLLAAVGEGGPERVAVTMAYACACAGFTQLIGLDLIVGAFAAGVAFPRDSRTVPPLAVAESLMPLAFGLFLPIYFLGAGLALDLDWSGFGSLLQLLALLAVACASKLAGGALPARLLGFSWGEALTLGVLVNTRGLMELVVLTVGFSEGVIGAQLFNEMVLMAILTTMATGPLLDFLRRRGVAAAAREPQVEEGTLVAG